MAWSCCCEFRQALESQLTLNAASYAQELSGLKLQLLMRQEVRSRNRHYVFARSDLHRHSCVLVYSLTGISEQRRLTVGYSSAVLSLTPFGAVCMPSTWKFNPD